jgi:hypothetical protein
MGEAKAQDELRVTLSFESEPLADALQTLGELAGWTVEVAGPAERSPVETSLHEATFEEALETILSPYDHTLIWSPDNLLTVFLMDERDSTALRAEKVEPATFDPVDNSPSIFSESETLVPPDGRGWPGLTSEDLAYYQASRNLMDPNFEELVPPSSARSDGITPADLEFLGVTRADNRSDDLELIPPDSEESAGPTAAELAAIIAARPVRDHSKIELVPPEESGGIAITRADLEAIRRERPPRDPSVQEDLVPPD